MVSSSIELISNEQNHNDFHNKGLELKSLMCKDHNFSITGFCVDEKCTENDKFICQMCFFEKHMCHEPISIDDLEKLIQKEDEDYKKYLETYDKNKTNLEEKMEKFEKFIINEIK